MLMEPHHQDSVGRSSSIMSKYLQHLEAKNSVVKEAVDADGARLPVWKQRQLQRQHQQRQLQQQQSHQPQLQQNADGTVIRPPRHPFFKDTSSHSQNHNSSNNNISSSAFHLDQVPEHSVAFNSKSNNNNSTTKKNDHGHLNNASTHSQSSPTGTHATATTSTTYVSSDESNCNDDSHSGSITSDYAPTVAASLEEPRGGTGGGGANGTRTFTLPYHSNSYIVEDSDFASVGLAASESLETTMTTDMMMMMGSGGGHATNFTPPLAPSSHRRIGSCGPSHALNQPNSMNNTSTCSSPLQQHTALSSSPHDVNMAQRQPPPSAHTHLNSIHHNDHILTTTTSPQNTNNNRRHQAPHGVDLATEQDWDDEDSLAVLDRMIEEASSRWQGSSKIGMSPTTTSHNNRSSPVPEDAPVSSSSSTALCLVAVTPEQQQHSNDGGDDQDAHRDIIAKQQAEIDFLRQQLVSQQQGSGGGGAGGANHHHHLNGNNTTSSPTEEIDQVPLEQIEVVECDHLSVTSGLTNLHMDMSKQFDDSSFSVTGGLGLMETSNHHHQPQQQQHLQQSLSSSFHNPLGGGGGGGSNHHNNGSVPPPLSRRPEADMASLNGGSAHNNPNNNNAYSNINLFQQQPRGVGMQQPRVRNEPVTLQAANGTVRQATYSGPISQHDQSCTGIGILKFSTGDLYMGSVVNGNMHGQGTYTFKHSKRAGRVLKGQFDNNVYVGCNNNSSGGGIDNNMDSSSGQQQHADEQQQHAGGFDMALKGGNTTLDEEEDDDDDDDDDMIR